VEGAASLTERALTSFGRGGADANPAAAPGPSPASKRYASAAASVRERYGTPAPAAPDKKNKKKR